jgi:uncharacterized protein YggE
MRAMILFGAVSVLLVGIAASASAAEEAQRRVTVTGTAVTMTVPDVIRWSLTTSDFDRNLLKAKEKSDRKLQAILGLRNDLGIKDEDMQTGQVSIQKVYERDRQGNQGAFLHFAVTREVSIRQRDLKRFDEYLTKLVSVAEVDLSFSFETSRFTELRKQTRLQALAAAKEKAEAMTQALGARVGRVLTIEEEEPERERWSTRSQNIEIDEGGRRASDLTSGTFAPGSIEVRVAVRVAFAIE